MTANELKNIPFPDCCKECELLTLLGASECESVCPEKFSGLREEKIVVNLKTFTYFFCTLLLGAGLGYWLAYYHYMIL